MNLGKDFLPLLSPLFHPFYPVDYRNFLEEELKGIFFQRHVFVMRSVQNLKSFWRSSQNYFVLALFCSLHS